MKTCILLYGQPTDVANELCSCNEPEEVLHVDLIAALGNALNRIAKLEKQVSDYQDLIRHAELIGGFKFIQPCRRPRSEHVTDDDGPDMNEEGDK